MKVLVTGAFGNIGANAVKSLLEQDHQVSCFDIKTETNEKAANNFKGKIEMFWGDIRNPEDVAAAVKGQDIVVHLAAIIPIDSEVKPDWAREINVGGTQNLVNEIKKLSPSPKIILASSTTVFGYTQDREPPLKVTDPVNPTNNYTNHKVECEKMVQESGLAWAILRFAAVTPIEFKLNPMMFYLSLDSRMEFTHTKDAGLALANAVANDEVWGKILLIGGGPKNQIRYRDYIHRSMQATGFGKFPDEAYGSIPATPDWVDTSESQRLLNYQHHTFEDWLKDRKASVGLKRYIYILGRPYYRPKILKSSPFLKAAKENA
ncbi:hypothetical protein ES703_06265 [subsurface metagenome]